MSEADFTRRGLLAAALAGSYAAVTGCAARDADPSSRNALLWAVAWKQTAAEYRALCYQAYNLARMRLDVELAAGHRKPLAVITDVDDTVLHAGSYWGHLVDIDRDFFDDDIWDQWIPRNLVTAVPGAQEFFRYCEERNVEVFYVTSRDQGESSFEFALQHLKELALPFADREHLTVFRESSDKTPARERIGESHEVVLFIGDNLNDYKRDYYVTGIDERLALMERDRDDYGRRFIVLPNPTDGHWVRAIFGESEPQATAQNLRILADAASRTAWDGT
ncbi:MAG: HAD family acid phosphatase [Woeseiaceae bacterium]